MRTIALRRYALQHSHGVSLIELLIGVAVATILMLHSLPFLRQSIDERAVLIQAEALRSDLRLARAQAMRRDAEVTVCPLAAGASAERPVCAEEAKDWSAGWVVFVDQSRRGTLEAEEPVLLVRQGAPQQGRVISTIDAMTYLSIGVSSSASARFTVLPPGAVPDGSRQATQLLVCVNKPGRPRLVSGQAC